MALDPAGKFAYVTNNGSNNVSAYTIDTSGGLDPMIGSPVWASTSPMSVAVEFSSGKFAYVTDNGSS